MNSDVLVFNRLFRYLPGIRPLTRAACRIDHLTTSLPGLRHAGLQVIGAARHAKQMAKDVDPDRRDPGVRSGATPDSDIEKRQDRVPI